MTNQILCTADDLIDWRKRMRISRRRAAAMLGCSAASLQKYERHGDVPLTVALAAAALLWGLPPIGSGAETNQPRRTDASCAPTK